MPRFNLTAFVGCQVGEVVNGFYLRIQNAILNEASKKINFKQIVSIFSTKMEKRVINDAVGTE